MTAIEEKYKHLRLANEIKPLLHRYGIEYDPKAKKEALLRLLLAKGVPLNRVQLNTIAPNLKKIAPLGLAQIVLDYPPSGPAPGGGEGSGSSVPGTESDPPPPPPGTESDPPPPPPGTESGPPPPPSGTESDPPLPPPGTESDPPLPPPGTESDPSLPPPGTESDPSLPPPGTESDPSLPPPGTESDPPLPPPGTESDPSLPPPGTESDPSLPPPGTESDPSLPPPGTESDPSPPPPRTDEEGRGGSGSRSLGLTDIKNKVTDLMYWFGSVVKSWYERTSNPDAKKQAAKRLDNLWSLALDSSGAAQPSTTAAATSDPTTCQDFFMDVIDPFDNMPTKGKVIGIHMTKKNTLGVRLPSLSIQYPDLGRGLWVDCKSEKDVEAYKKFVQAFPGTGKLSSAPETLLAGCETPADFKLDCVFRM
ncbi:hypothetical protein V8F33_010337, partial [Rhypophila sp. PSN 637]